MNSLSQYLMFSGLVAGAIICYLILLVTGTGLVTAARHTRFAVFFSFAFFVLKGCTYFVPLHMQDRADAIAVYMVLASVSVYLWPSLVSLFKRKRESALGEYHNHSHVHIHRRQKQDQELVGHHHSGGPSRTQIRS